MKSMTTIGEFNEGDGKGKYLLDDGQRLKGDDYGEV